MSEGDNGRALAEPDLAPEEEPGDDDFVKALLRSAMIHSELPSAAWAQGLRRFDMGEFEKIVGGWVERLQDEAVAKAPWWGVTLSPPTGADGKAISFSIIAPKRLSDCTAKQIIDCLAIRTILMDPITAFLLASHGWTVSMSDGPAPEPKPLILLK